MELAVEKRIHRVIQVLLHIESGPRFNARTLADMFGVKRRTIYRDVAILRNVGFVITFDETVDAYVLTTPKSPAYNFELSAADLEMLAVAAKLAAPALSRQQFHRVESALARLMGSFPVETRIELNQLFNSLHADSDPAAAPNNDPVWQLIVHAIRNRLQVRITLRGAKPIQTKLDPYQLIASGSGWKVVGRSSLHRATKSFPLIEIAQGEITDDSFVPPRGAHRKANHEST